MNSLVSRVSYLQGLINGLEIDKASKEGKVIVEIADILSDMASETEYLKESQFDMEEYLDALDEDLQDVENTVYDEDDEEENDDDDYDDEEDDEDDFISIKCPNCSENIYVEQDMINDEKIKCPNCGKSINLNDLCECDDCCDHE